jgi:hypothetical protein
MAGADALTQAAFSGTGLGILAYAGALGIGAIFVQAGQAKLQHRELLGGVIANYRLLPGALVAPVALLLPWAEIGIGLGLIVGGAAVLAPAAMALLLIFAAAMGINVARGRREIDCGCGRSDLRQPLGWLLVLRNLVLAALLVPSLLAPPRFGFAGADFLIATAGGLAICLLYLLFNAIGALAASPLAASRR